jgi:hypothetical protein
MPLGRLHVGVTVWPARSDFFHYLRNWVGERSPQEAYRKLSLPPDLLALVSRLEYSPFWMLRVFLYAKVARFLEQEIRTIMDGAKGDYREVIFYTPDDGYWAELFHAIRGRVDGPLKIFNVQHGQPALVRRPQRLRRLVNRISVALTGYPNFGYGFGAGTLDGYVVMSVHEKKFIEENFSTPVYVAPYFVRGDFFDTASKVRQSVQPQKKLQILFAMNPIFATQSNLLGGRTRAENMFFRDIADCLRLIKKTVSCEIVFRFHPGQSREAVEREFQAAGLQHIAVIDENFSIIESLAGSDFVLAYASTVLFEAALLGKVPVNFVPAAYPPPWALTIPVETIVFDRDANGEATLKTGRGPVEALFNRDVVKDYVATVGDINYAMPLPWLD